jgi:hypothetical protein
LADEITTITHAVPNAEPDVVGYIHTPEGKMSFTYGDWIAENVTGERWPIKNEIFQKTYKEDNG